MTDPVLLTEIDDRGVATLTLNRPEKHNALSGALIDALADALRAVRDVRVFVLTGAGASFCAGGDLAWMQAQFQETRAGRIREARRLAEMLRALNACPRPVIARVNGQAYGGGVGLLCAVDVAVAVDTARFGLTETRLGLTPATISPYVLARLGEGAARRVFMSSRRFDAAEAEALGLVARVVPGDALDAAAAREVEPYLACSPNAVAEAKALARRLGPVIDEAALAATAEHLADIWESEDAREGLAAFFEKRPPRWAAR